MLTQRKPLERRTPLRNTKPMARSREKKGPGLAQRIARSLGVAINHSHSEPSVFRSRQHRMTVASLDCVCCGKQKHSQAAHLNLLALGKGMGIKLSDALTIPLCATDFGTPGCHVLLDSSGQYDKSTSAALQLSWLDETMNKLKSLGKWPAEAQADVERLVIAYLKR